ncbi:hypothetical protein I552_2628 [Mycobacterium xenopi 3993]|nr:hypothetical protein I552_2628 [Mycobacterium xenopi 3993]
MSGYGRSYWPPRWSARASSCRGYRCGGEYPRKLAEARC